MAEGQPIVSIAKEAEPEIVVNVPEDQLAAFKASRYKARLASAPDAGVRRRAAGTVAAGGGANANVPRSPEARNAAAAAARRNRHARGRAAGRAKRRGRHPRLGDHAEQGPARGVGRSSRRRRAGRERSTCIAVSVHGYRNDEVLVSGPPAGELVVTAGVQKMAPGLKVALPDAAADAEPKQAAR